MTELRATQRLQFHRDFTLDDAIPLIPYFARLGISHIYSSPLLKARPGSTHGYDMVDPTQINPELGGEAALERLVKTLRQHNMGLIVDFVPNHMAVGGDANPWWLDVLEWGMRSPYAQFFDIHWNSPDPLLKGQLLVPFLRTDYGEVLAYGEVALQFDAQKGKFLAKHYDHHFPIYPPSYSEILRKTGVQTLELLARRFDMLERNPDHRQAAQHLSNELCELAADPTIKAAIDNAIAQFTVPPCKDTRPPADIMQSDNLKRLHELLELQHYRLASWRTAVDDINWRRFFDINELGAVRTESAEVFEALHAKIFELIERGWIDGLRIDHVDGLANPRTYCRKLRRRVDRLTRARQQPFPIYVEKILGEGEHLPYNWSVEGTTGYEFMNQVSLVQHDPVGALQLYGLWANTTGRTASFKDEIIEARRLVLSSSLAGDFESVARGLLEIARTDIATRDLTLGAIRRALFELIVYFPVYRTYAGACARGEQDRRFFAEALEGARTALSESDWPLLEYLDRWLGGEPLNLLPPGRVRRLRRRILARFQQLTSPTAAKAVEDTACYRSAVLLSRNDVGFDPYHFSVPLSQFHEQCETRAQHFPNNLLATATHDHKRGEDTRARLAVISERSVWFAEKIERWQNLARAFKTETDEGTAPSAGDEIMLYQTLLGSWPLALTLDETDELKSYAERIQRWWEKSVREAKLRSSWSTPNTVYETACRDFLNSFFFAQDAAELRQDVFDAAQSLAPAGALNGLVQTLLRVTTPGVPDLYQGAEFWDFSLVDPDNRRPVDFAARDQALATMPAAAAVSPAYVGELLHHWRDGRIKQYVIAKCLCLRRRKPALFSKGAYIPLTVEGEQADRVIAFARTTANDSILVIAPRLSGSFISDDLSLDAEPWRDIRIKLPESFKDSNFSHELTGSPQLFHSDSGYLAATDLFSEFPLAVLSLHDPITESM